MTKIYVGNLPFSASEDAVRALFAAYGTVQTLSLVNDRQTGTPRGFGFVEMSSDEEAQKAIDMWNGKEFGGRTLTVNEARPMEERPRGGGGGYRGGNDRAGFGGGRGGGNRW